jgi:hypothetical protein
MEGYQTRVNSIAVPKNTGIDGFLRTLKEILGLSRVQSISIDATGKIDYTRYVREAETDNPISVDYAGLDPWSIIRNGDLVEMRHPPDLPAPSIIALMFNRITREDLVPIAFATGADSDFWEWHRRTAGVELSPVGSAYGLPLYTDRQMPDHALVLCAGFAKGGLAECHRFLSVSMGIVDNKPPVTSVMIL